MARVLVHGATVQDGKLEKLLVQLGHLPKKVIDRDTAVSWMRDMHSLVPMKSGSDLPALQLVEVVDDEDVQYFIRTDNEAEASDLLPELPAAS